MTGIEFDVSIDLLTHNQLSMTTTTMAAPLHLSQRVPECSAMSVNPKRFGRLLGKLTKGRIKAVEGCSKQSSSVSSVKCMIPGRFFQPSASDGTITSTHSLDGGVRNDKPTVSFGSVEVREHGRLLVEHPFCPDGLALGLDWEHSSKSQVMHIDLYERIRRSQGRRSNEPLERLCTFDRKLLLMKVGGYKEKMLWKVFQENLEVAHSPG